MNQDCTPKELLTISPEMKLDQQVYFDKSRYPNSRIEDMTGGDTKNCVFDQTLGKHIPFHTSIIPVDISKRMTFIERPTCRSYYDIVLNSLLM